MMSVILTSVAAVIVVAIVESFATYRHRVQRVQLQRKVEDAIRHPSRRCPYCDKH